MDNQGNPTREPTNEELYQQPPHSPAAHPAANLPAPNPHMPLAPAQREPAAAPAKQQAEPGLKMQMTLAIISLVMAMPLSLMAANYGGLFGIVVTWLGIIGVNAVFYRVWNPPRDKN